MLVSYVCEIVVWFVTVFFYIFYAQNLSFNGSCATRCFELIKVYFFDSK